jgi:soluble lytic murein transglycosylase-like protein
MEGPELIRIAKAMATAHDLAPELVCAVVEQESNWDTWAVRMEPAFYERYEKPKNLSDTEEYTRSMSWGLMQVMGETARGVGFTSRFFSQLCDPLTGLEIGCRVLKAKLALVNNCEHDGLLRYNGGGNHAYPDQVLARKHKYL